MLGKSESPFIDEGDDLTSVRERVRMLLSLAAHVGRYKMMVGTTILFNVRCTWEVASSPFGMADVGACHTVDAERHAGGFTMFV